MASRSEARLWKLRDASAVLIATFAAVITGYAAWSVGEFESFAVQTRREIVAAKGNWPPARKAEAAGTARAWAANPFVAARALSLIIDTELGVKDPDTKRIELALVDLLMRKPTYGASWQSLAQIRMVNGARFEEVLPLVRTSAIMAPQDGHVMVPRAIIGIQNWAELPETDRNRTVSDVLGVTGSTSAVFQWPLLAEVIGEQPDTTKSDLRRRLATERPKDVRMLKLLGL